LVGGSAPKPPEYFWVNENGRTWHLPYPPKVGMTKAILTDRGHRRSRLYRNVGMPRLD